MAVNRNEVAGLVFANERRRRQLVGLTAIQAPEDKADGLCLKKILRGVDDIR
jgi:hypothetical protein